MSLAIRSTLRVCGELFLNLAESKVALRECYNFLYEFGFCDCPLRAAKLGDAPAQDLSPGYFFYPYCATWSPGHWRNAPRDLELNFQLSWRFMYRCKAWGIDVLFNQPVVSWTYRTAKN